MIKNITTLCNLTLVMFKKFLISSYKKYIKNNSIIFSLSKKFRGLNKYKEIYKEYFLFSFLSRYLLIIIFFAFSNAEATRIKDIANIEGVRENLLVGYGLVVGLNGTGDNLKNSVFTQMGLVEFLEKLGVNTQGANLKTKNIAAVTVIADLPPFAKQGSRIDIKVSALGDAKSLKGGTLIATPMVGSDGNVYAVAQGQISIAEFDPASSNVKTQGSKIETSGYIQNGAIVENELEFDYKNLAQLRFSLNSPDFKTSITIADAINNVIPGNTAVPIDPSTIQVTVPNYRKEDVIQFIAEIESLNIETDYKAKVVINETTGTIVIGENVRIRPVAIAQGNLVVNVTPGDIITGATAPAKKQQIEAALDTRRGQGFVQLDGSANLSEVVAGLNKLGIWPKDIINVLHSMKSVGALDAIIEVK